MKNLTKQRLQEMAGLEPDAPKRLSNNDFALIEKEIKKRILEFDNDFHEYRYKAYFVFNEGTDIFVEYITQEDYENEGKFEFETYLQDFTSENYNIYYHYIVRDKSGSIEMDIKTKEGYDLVG